MIVEAPVRSGPSFTELPDLVSERVGGKTLACSDDFFASMTNLLKPSRAEFDPHAYTDRGKLMDGWESRRSFGRPSREPGGHTHDWCVIELGMRGIVRGVDVDTSFFRGNFPEFAALDGSTDGVKFEEILPKSELRGDDSNFLAVSSSEEPLTHLRLRIFPDGGVARLRVYGIVVPDWKRILAMGTAVDLAAVENGGVVVAANDMFFGSRHNLIMPGRSVNMGDGWETRRKRREGHDWTIVQLGRPGAIKSLEVDTNHFKGNFPESCWLEGSDDQQSWFPILPRTELRGHTRHHFVDLENNTRACSHVRLSIHPDGGISRLRVYGVPA